jgi:biotin carboxylase
MRRSRFIFIESNTTGSGVQFIRHAAELGFVPVLLTADPSRYRQLLSAGAECVVDDTSDVDRLASGLDRMAQDAPIAGVFSSSEYFAETAAMLAGAHGLPAADPAAIACCRRKRAQRERARQCGVPVPDFRAAHSVDEVSDALAAMPLPVVVKPTWGSGSIGVRWCGSRTDAERHAADLLAQRVNERGLPVPQEVLIEAYVEGGEYSVELCHGTVVGITRKHLSAAPLFIEMGHDYPAPLPSESATALGRVALQAVSAVGMHWGPTHVELRLTTDGPVLIEVNPRLAGGLIPELVRLASGVDLVCETVRLASGEQPRLQPRWSAAASIRFLVAAHDGPMAALGDLDRIQQLPLVTEARISKAAGERIARHGDFRDRVGHVICAGASVDEVAAAAEHARAVLRLEMENAHHATTT